MRPDVTETKVALSRREVDHAQDRVVPLPQIDERIDELQPILRADDLDEARGFVRQLTREFDERGLNVGEVLVEGRGRRPCALRDLDDGEIAVRLLVEKVG